MQEMGIPEAMIFGSVGEPPDEALKVVGSRIINPSTIKNVADCPIYGTLGNMFEDDRVGGMSKNLGSLWHDWIDPYHSPLNPDPDNRTAHADEQASLTSDKILAKAEKYKLDKFLSDWESWMIYWYNPAKVRYVENPIGSRANVDAKVLATEVPFWIVVGAREADQWNTPPTMLIGTLDQILSIDDELWIGEWKTVDEKENLADWIAHRRWTPQHVIYQLGLFMLVNELNLVNNEYSRIFAEFPESVDWPKEAGGTFYQFLRRQKFPQKASSDKTKEQRIAEWEKTLFEEIQVPADMVEAVDVAIGYIRQTYSVYPSMPDEHYRNPSACKRWGSRCMFADICIDGIDPGLLDYLVEADNYVRDALLRSSELEGGDEGSSPDGDEGTRDMD